MAPDKVRDDASDSPLSLIPLDYGNLELPEFSEEETALRGLELDPDELIWALKESDDISELLGKTGSYALRYADKAVQEFVIGKIDDLPVAEPLKIHAKQVMESKNWEGVEADSGEYFALRELVAKANRITFVLINEWLEKGENLGLTPVATLEYKNLMPAMAATDRLYLKMVTEKAPISSDERMARGLTNECAVVKEINGEVVEIPFNKAFPYETAEIAKCYKHLLEDLYKLEDSVDEQLCRAESAGRVIGESIDGDMFIGMPPAGSAESVPLRRSLILINKKISYYEAVLAAFNSGKVEGWRKADALLP